MVDCAQDIHKQSVDDELASVMDLVYFEGDFWPNVIEEHIKELDQEERAQASGEVSVEFLLCNAYLVLYFVKIHRSSINGDPLPTPNRLILSYVVSKLNVVPNTMYSIILGRGQS